MIIFLRIPVVQYISRVSGDTLALSKPTLYPTNVPSLKKKQFKNSQISTGPREGPGEGVGVTLGFFNVGLTLLFGT